MAAPIDVRSSPVESTPGIISRTVGTIIDFLWHEANFFRLHVSAFVMVPLALSGIFYGSNGQFHIRYIDSLFLCYSAMTDTGLATVNLSTLTTWQQIILYLLIMLGNTTFISWLMVMTRKHYFRTHCRYVASRQPPRRLRRSRRSLLASISAPINAFQSREAVPPRNNAKAPFEVTDGSMEDGTPVEGLSTPWKEHLHDGSIKSQGREGADTTFSSSLPEIPTSAPSTFPSSDGHDNELPRAHTSSPILPRQRRALTFREDESYHAHRSQSSNVLPTRGVPPPFAHNRKYEGFGGFPGPVDLINTVLKRAAPSTYRRLERTMTVPSTMTLEGRSEPWLNFDALVVGRNSDFRTDTLTSEQIKDIGGTEYRALRLLSWLVPAYALGVQVIGFLVFAPWLQVTSKYNGAFEAQPRLVPKAWFSMFQVTSAYTGTGFSLIDLSMVPFQQAYLMIFGIMFIQLAGNPAQPILLRFIIWIGYKLSHVSSEARQTLSFLLHHPRRCFLYLFPSHQTYFLCIVLVLLSALEWTAFGILNIGLPAFEALPIGTRVVTGIFQGVAARASGFQVVSLAPLAPALQFLYAVLMYIAIYPVALCVRATNVYEERSLGIFEAPLGEIKEDLAKLPSRERVGRYVNWHLRRQLSIDIWWLVWGIFIVAIIERGNLMDQSKRWFNMFSLIFELVSAFAGIGLSLGFPGDDFSLVGTMKPLSKIVIIIIMIRGRHRGLPVAIDRAVLLPTELVVNSGTPDAGSPQRGSSGVRSPAQEESVFAEQV